MESNLCLVPLHVLKKFGSLWLHWLMKKRLGSCLKRRPAWDTDSNSFIYSLCATVFGGLLFGSIFSWFGWTLFGKIVEYLHRSAHVYLGFCPHRSPPGVFLYFLWDSWMLNSVLQVACLLLKIFCSCLFQGEGVLGLGKASHGPLLCVFVWFPACSVQMDYFKLAAWHSRLQIAS